MSDEFDVDMVVSVLEYESLLVAAVRDALVHDDPNHPARVLLAKRAPILSDATRRRIAGLIIESDSARSWMEDLRALQAVGKPPDDDPELRAIAEEWQ